jgi:hypothetical protein
MDVQPDAFYACHDSWFHKLMHRTSEGVSVRKRRVQVPNTGPQMLQ